MTSRFREYICLVLAMIGLPALTHAVNTNVDNIAAHYYFAGRTRLAEDTNFTTLDRIAVLASTTQLQGLMAERFSTILANGLHLGTNPATPLLIQPLVSNLFQVESLGAFGGPPGQSLNFILALRLDSGQRQSWQDTFANALGGPGEKFSMEGFTGWNWTRNGSDSLWIIPARDWLLVGRGQELQPLQSEYLRAVSQDGRPAPLGDALLQTEIDFPRLQAWFPNFGHPFKPARVEMRVAGKNGGLRMTAHITYPDAVPWQPRPWILPKDLIRSPLVSFTAAQDVAAYLNLSPLFTQVETSPLTNEFYAWAVGQMPLQSFLAWPVPDATNALKKLAAEAVTNFNPMLKQFNRTQLVWAPQYSKLIMSNLRVVTPVLGITKDSASPFLLLSFFPLPLRSQPAPDSLWAQIKGRNDLVYYDWEATDARLPQWRLLGGMLMNPRGGQTPAQTDAAVVEDRWLDDVRSLLGHTITEVTRPSANELSVIRTSQAGLTAIEWIMLSNWLKNAASNAP